MGLRGVRAAAAALGVVALLGSGALGAPAAAAWMPTATGPSSSPSVDAGGQCTPGERVLVPGQSYLVDRLGLDAAWPLGRGRGVTVAVVDSGVEAGNAHLADALVPGVSTFGDGTAPADDDLFGHGTAIAGLIAARPVEGSGIVGIAPEARIMPVRAFEAAPDDGQSSRDIVGPSAESVTAGIRWAADQGAQIINVSLSDDQAADLYASAVSYAQARGSLVIASAGNRNTANANRPDPEHFYPGEVPGALAVSAVLKDGAWDPDSSYAGEHVDIAAPGQAMPSAYISGGDCVFNGDSASSSYATAVVSGAAALVAGRYPDETPDQWAFRLLQSAMRVAPTDPTATVGWGEVRPAEALALVDDGTLPGPPSPAHPGGDPEPEVTRTISIEPDADPLDPARAIIGWALGGAATISAIMLLVARGRARSSAA